MDTKSAIITGISGQDAAYLAELLLQKGYLVYGTHRTESKNFWRLKELGIDKHAKLKLRCFDYNSLAEAINLVEEVAPDEIYNLAAQTFIQAPSTRQSPLNQITAHGPYLLMEAARQVNKSIKFFQASTSEIFGNVTTFPQDENTQYNPRNFYGIAKLYAHCMANLYRETYGMFVCSAILYNHESPLRGPEFLTRKVTQAIARIAGGENYILEVGNLSAQRDWGYARDYVRVMYKMLQHSQPDNYILATGVLTSVREFIELAFESVEISIDWSGERANEVGKCQKTGKVMVKVKEEFYRASESIPLVGDSSKAINTLGFEHVLDLKELCVKMVQSDLARINCVKNTNYGVFKNES